MPCLVPPHCVVTVTEPQYRSVMHKIAEKYSGEALLSDGNMIWFLCDLAMYNEVYPDEASIADWAKDAVLFCRVAEILPKDATSLHPTQKN